MTTLAERENWDSIHEFLRYWDAPAKLEGNPQIAIVPCNLVYGVGSEVKHVSTMCHIFVKDGRVSILEKDWFNPFDFYSEFDVRWQRFSVTAAKALRIYGNGPKLGDYWVEITPLIPA